MVQQRQQKSIYRINDGMNVLLSKLDEAIDDLENGCVLTEEELWEEIDSIQRIGYGNKRLQNRKLALTERNA